MFKLFKSLYNHKDIYMRKIALITGITGQDGAYLAKFLKEKNYKVIGTYTGIKPNLYRLKKLNILKKIILIKMNINNSSQISKILERYKINEIYNLASQSYVDKSFKNPINTNKVNALGALYLLEAIKKGDKTIKFYQASSSEMFGNSKNVFQSEKTKFEPQSPYAISKLFAHYMTRHYRETYNIFAVSGILFNHESPLRDENFVSSKIIKGLINFKNNKGQAIELGNINIKRDWGYSKEYVVQMWKMLQTKKPDDYVIATGKSHSLKKMINISINYLNIKAKWIGKGLNLKLVNISNNKTIIRINKKYFRPNDINSTKGNISKAKKILNWKPKTSFKNLIKILINDKIKQ